MIARGRHLPSFGRFSLVLGRVLGAAVLAAAAALVSAGLVLSYYSAAEIVEVAAVVSFIAAIRVVK